MIRCLLLLFFLLPLPVSAVLPARICEDVAQQVAAESGVPADVLRALTLTETGRRQDGDLRPWAWAVNAAGQGFWFDDPESALGFVENRIASGHANIDIGCFQLNYRWHGKSFASVRDMFDPLRNARYAARFLTELHAEMGDWRLAAGAFHSRRPADAARYLARFDVLRTQLLAGGMTAFPRDFIPDDDLTELTAEQFAALTGTRMQRPERQRRMLLGAPLGTGADGGAGSLAAMGAGRGPLLVAGTGGGLFVQAERGPLMP